MKYFKFYNILTIIIFSIILLVGIATYKNYGVSWDEPIQREYGQAVYNYVTGENKALQKNKEKYYGPLFETSLIFVEKTFNIADIQDVYFSRHLLNFLLFYLGLVTFYSFLKIRFSNYAAIFGVLVLAIHPRIWAHSFYNSKDIPLLVFFIISFATMQQLLNKKNNRWLILHGIASSAVISIRIVGVMIPIITLIVLALQYALEEKDTSLKMIINKLGFYAFITAIVTVIFWPTLWHNPIKEFLNAFEAMKQYDQSTHMLYYGEKISSTKVPWHYTLGWLYVTTPIVYLLFALLGFCKIIYEWIINKKINIIDLSILLWFFVPLVSVIYFKSVLYDSWRQMFFIYPAFIYFVIRLIFTNGKKIKYFLAVILVTQIIYTVIQMSKLHPHENVYFSETVHNKQNLSTRFELDYWGLSYKQAFEYLIEHENKEIHIYVENKPGLNNVEIMPKEYRDKIKIEKQYENAEYYLTNYRKKEDISMLEEIYTIRVYENNIVGIYKIDQ
ncbi:MAG: ArnT family glycosyltransferase [Patescibacteria group bacterium]